MRSVVHPKLEEARILTGPLASTAADGLMGAFDLPYVRGTVLRMISSGPYEGWEHVSASLQTRCPIWAEMTIVKNLFWDDEECVLQFHPPRSQYVNQHPHCLHLWRPLTFEMPLPPRWML